MEIWVYICLIFRENKIYFGREGNSKERVGCYKNI